MKDITQANLSDAVKSSFEPIDNPRMRLLVDRLVHHQHAYAQDTGLTHAEWREGIAFLHRSASITTPSRSEFTLISDVLRPFHTCGSPWMQSGANLINGNAGAAVVVRGQVTDIGGQALPGAALDFGKMLTTACTGSKTRPSPKTICAAR